MNRDPQPRLPWSDLVAWCRSRHEDPEDSHNIGAIGVVTKVTGRHRGAVARWADDGIPFWSADRLAHSLEVHPIEIWGSAWIEATLGAEWRNGVDLLVS